MRARGTLCLPQAADRQGGPARNVDENDFLLWVPIRRGLKVSRLWYVPQNLVKHAWQRLVVEKVVVEPQWPHRRSTQLMASSSCTPGINASIAQSEIEHA